MKRYITPSLLFMLLCWTGCSIKHDYSLCGLENNCVLSFVLKGADGTDLFHTDIDYVDVLLFDADHTFMLHKKADKASLNSFAGVKLTVPPGDYHVVCWANVGPASQFSPLNDRALFEECYLETVSDECGCELYYAPHTSPETSVRNGVVTRNQTNTIFKIHVPENGVTVKELFFVRAYRSVNVYIQNFSNHPDYDDQYPVVEITDLPYKYDFFLHADPARKTYQRVSSDQTIENAGTVSYARINTPIAEFENNMTVHIKRGSDGQTIYSLNLKSYVEENLNDIEDINELDILVRFDINADVTVSVPDWDEWIVNPI